MKTRFCSSAPVAAEGIGPNGQDGAAKRLFKNVSDGFPEEPGNLK